MGSTVKKLLTSAALALAIASPSPVIAQESNTVGADIGPSELSNFSLNGSVTRPAERPAPATPTPTPSPAPTTRAPATAEPSRPAATDTRSSAQPARPSQQADTGDLLDRPVTLPQRQSSSNTVAAPAPGPGFSEPGASNPIPPTESGFSFLPWIAGLFLLAGGAAIGWFLRQRRDTRYAADGAFASALDPTPVAPSPTPQRPAPNVADTAPAQPRHDPIPARKPLPTTLMPKPPEPAPAPPPVQPPVSAAVDGGVTTRIPSAAPAGGIVSTSLRPWLDVELSPERALIDDNGAAIAFDIIIANSGSAPARAVTIEAQLLNAGAQQDMELSAFFGTQKSGSDPIPVIEPYSKVALRSAVRIPRNQIREYAVDGRKLFVPMVAVSARYRWSSGEGQTGAGFLVGKNGEQEKLGPLRVDQGARSWEGLGSRRYEKGVRR